MQRVLRVVNWKEPTGTIRLNHSSLSKDGAVRMQVANVPVRNRRTAGVQAPPKLSIMIDYVERGKAVSSPCATHGRQTVRHAYGGTELRGWKKQMPLCSGVDRARNIAQL